MKVAVFWGCRILTSQCAYEMSIRGVLPKFDLELVDLREALCCGDPIKSVNDFAANYLSARVLALANLTGAKDLLVPCNRCHFAVSEAKSIIEKDERARAKIVGLLKEEGLQYNPDTRIWHVIDSLHDLIGLDRVKKAVVKPLKGIKLATHYGCQILRYGDLGRVDDAENPRKLDELVGVLGAESVDYAERLDCCGSALTYSHVDSALSLAGSKLKAVQNSGVDGLIVSCPDCGIMFDAKQKDAAVTVGAKLSLPVVYYTQLLGLALSIEQGKLGLNLNQSSVDQLLAKIPA
jgi:heterodisulfide reductase subunit B